MLFLSCMCATAPQLPLRTLRVGISFPAFLNVFPWVHFCLSCSFSFALSVFFKHLEIFGHPAISRLSFKFHYLFIYFQSLSFKPYLSLRGGFLWWWRAACSEPSARLCGGRLLPMRATGSRGAGSAAAAHGFSCLAACLFPDQADS